MNAHWSNKYVGLSGANYHCWGLVRLVYRSELHIDLPAYEGSVLSAAERAEVSAIVAGEVATGPWVEVGLEIRPFDVLTFRHGHLRTHVAIAVDRRHMLHVLDHARIDRLSARRWRSLLMGVYRHVELLDRGEA